MLVEVVNFKTSRDYEFNLQKVIKKIKNSPADFILFPEVCLTGFDYANWQKANAFAKTALKELSKLKKAFALTLIVENRNCFCLFESGLIYKRAKYSLFGNEKEYFEKGGVPEIFEWRGLKVAAFVCFELRFTEYWQKIKGADLVIVPARWGKERIEHFRTLNRALALSVQANVLFANSANESPFGGVYDGWGDGMEITCESGICTLDFEKNRKIRKKLDIGIR